MICASISQLERELIVERVKNGLKNARMKGKIIGRKKTRPSEIIRALLKKQLPYRTISSVANCSSGSVWAEKKAMMKEEEQARLKITQEVAIETGMEMLAQTKAQPNAVDPTLAVVSLPQPKQASA